MPKNGPLNIDARHAKIGDVPDLLRMYRELSAEQSAIREIWPHADGLDAPIEASLMSLVNDNNVTVVVGEIDGVGGWLSRCR